MRNIIFLDFDGVLNCEVFYKTQQFADYKEAKKSLRKEVKNEKIDRLDYYAGQICKDRIQLLNNLCAATDSKIVISSTWRLGKTIEELQEVLNYCGATCMVLDKTGSCACRNRETHIMDTNLPVRASNILRSNQINTIGELINHSEGSLSKLHGMGKTSINEIQSCLRDTFNISLKQK